MEEVDVAPAQSEELAAAHAGVCREPERREEPVAVRGLQEGVELRGGPGAELVAGPASSRGLGVGGDFGDDEATPARVAESLVQDDADPSTVFGSRPPLPPRRPLASRSA